MDIGSFVYRASTTSWPRIPTTTTRGNSLLGTLFTFSLLVNPGNGLLFTTFKGVACIALSSSTFLLADPLGPPRKIRPPSPRPRAFLGGDPPLSEERFFFGNFSGESFRRSSSCGFLVSLKRLNFPFFIKSSIASWSWWHSSVSW